MSWYISNHQFYINESVEWSIPQIRQLSASNSELKEILKKQDQIIKELVEEVVALKEGLENLKVKESASGTDKK